MYKFYWASTYIRVNWYWFCKTTNVVNKENVYELSFPKRNGVGFGSISYRFFAYLESRYVFGYGTVNKFSIPRRIIVFVTLN